MVTCIILLKQVIINITSKRYTLILIDIIEKQALNYTLEWVGKWIEINSWMFDQFCSLGFIGQLVLQEIFQHNSDTRYFPSDEQVYIMPISKFLELLWLIAPIPKYPSQPLALANGKPGFNEIHKY